MSAIYRTSEGEAACKAAYAAFRDHWPVPREELRIPTRFGETFVVACGDREKPPLILLHGAGSNSFMWLGDVAAWSQAFRIYAVDLLGEVGESAPARPPRGSSAEWLDEVLAALGVQRASFAGLSLGGWTALHYALNRPEKVERLVLLAPGGLGRTKLGFWLQGKLINLMGAKARQRILAKIGAGAGGPVADYLGLVFTHFIPRTDPVPRFRSVELARLKAPVLLIVGEQDTALDSEGSRRRLAASVPRAKITMLPGVGHAVIGQTAPVLEFLTAP